MRGCRERVSRGAGQVHRAMGYWIGGGATTSHEEEKLWGSSACWSYPPTSTAKRGFARLASPAASAMITDCCSTWCYRVYHRLESEDSSDGKT